MLWTCTSSWWQHLKQDQKCSPVVVSQQSPVSSSRSSMERSCSGRKGEGRRGHLPALNSECIGMLPNLNSECIAMLPNPLLICHFSTKHRPHFAAFTNPVGALAAWHHPERQPLPTSCPLLSRLLSWSCACKESGASSQAQGTK